MIEKRMVDGVEKTFSIDDVTGGMKEMKLCQLGFVDPLALEKLGEVAGHGAEKYEKFNYLKGYDYSLSINSAYRHFLAMQRGEDYDPESGLLHSVHACWHLLALTSFICRGLGNDDRYKQPEPLSDEEMILKLKRSKENVKINIITERRL